MVVKRFSSIYDLACYCERTGKRILVDKCGNLKGVVKDEV